MARRVAARLAPEVGAKLPAYVERLIALVEHAVEEGVEEAARLQGKR